MDAATSALFTGLLIGWLIGMFHMGMIFWTAKMRRERDDLRKLR